ncbi:MAG: peptidase M41, partial [Alistipes sp.]|nr:peptidase M41 [Alistipes sp.]
MMPWARLNFMWVYAAIALFIIGSWLLGEERNTPLKGDWSMVAPMVEQGDVARISVINNRKVDVFLKPEAIAKYRADSTDMRLHNMPEKGVQVTFQIGSVDALREDLQTAQGAEVPVVYEFEENGWLNIIGSILPWVLIIGVWFFIMRAMARG